MKPAVYLFLSNILIDPKFEHMDTIAPIMAEMRETINDKMKLGIDGIISTWEKRKTLSGTELTDFDAKLSLEYTKIFSLGDVEPLESAYVCDMGRKQGARNAMIALFAECRPNYNEPEDHIGNEMLLMSYYSANNSVNEQLYLYQEHLCRWLGALAEKVRLFQRDTDFYNHIVNFMEGFIEEDFKVLKG